MTRDHIPGSAEIAARMMKLDQTVRRRSLLGGALGLAGSLALAGRLPGASVAAQDAALPDDAAPVDQQVFVMVNDLKLDKTPDFYESVYERLSESAFDILSEPLVRLNRDFEIEPAGALEWSSNDDGTVWTFKLNPDLMWSDGNPVTANDWVRTFQYGADPAHAWDFTWYFQGVIKGWNEAIADDIPLDELGVRQCADEHELVIETAAGNTARKNHRLDGCGGESEGIPSGRIRRRHARECAAD